MPPPEPGGERTKLRGATYIEPARTLDVTVEDLGNHRIDSPRHPRRQRTLLQIERNRIAMENVASRWPRCG